MVVPTHQRPKLLEETLLALIAQSYRPIEIIVVEDGCDDLESQQCVRKIQESLPDGVEIKYLTKDREGAPAARNHGAMETRGEYIVFMDDDDVAAIDFLSSRIDALEANETATFAYGPWMRFVPFGERYQLIDYKGLQPRSEDAHWYSLLNNWDLLLQGCVIRRSVVSRTGPWRGDLEKSQDLDYKTRMIADADCLPVHTSDGPIFYRLHQDSISGSRTAAKMDSHVRVLDDIEAISVQRPDYEESRERLADFLWYHAFSLYASGDFTRGHNVLRRAQFHDRNICRRKGLLPGLLAALRLEIAIGPCYFVISRCKRSMGLSNVRVEAVTNSLPTSVSLPIT